MTIRDIKHAKATNESSAEDALKKRKRERKATKDLNLLSFGDEEAAFEAPSKQKTKRKKMMSSHDLLDDKKLKSQVDEELLQKIAEAEPSAKSEVREKKAEKKLSAKDSLKAAVAAASVGKKEVKSEPSSDEPMGVASKETRITDTKSKAKEGKKQEQDEYQQLRAELKKSRKAVPVLMGDRAKEQEKERAFHDMLTPLQQQRQKYLQRKKAATRSSRQQDTLEKLKQFQSTLIAANTKKTGSGEEQEQEKGEEKKKEAYHGQVLESDDEDDLKGDLSWMAAKLKFKKHIDVRGARFVACSTSVMCMATNRAMIRCCIPQDQFRAGAGPSVDVRGPTVSLRARSLLERSGLTSWTVWTSPRTT